MGLITKINGLAYANTAKYSGVTKVNTKKVGGTGNFHNKNAVAKSVTEPGDTTHSILLADSNGDFKFTDDSAFTFSLWIKVLATAKSSVMVVPDNDHAPLKCLSEGTVASEADILLPSLSTMLVVAIGFSFKQLLHYAWCLVLH